MNKYEKNKYKFYIVAAISIIIVICFYLYNKTGSYDDLKIDKSKKLVYTISEEESGDFNQYKPYLNIKGELGKTINYDITEFFNYFDEKHISITYENDLNGKILSIILKVEDHGDTENTAVLYYRSYNINLSTQEILSNDKIFNYYDITSTDVENKLNDAIQKYYNKLVEEDYILEDECDYNCFLNTEDIKEGIDDAEFYIKDGKLYAYKPRFANTTYDDGKIKHSFRIK